MLNSADLYSHESMHTCMHTSLRRAVSDVCAGSSVLMNTWLHATRLSNPSSGEAPASPANSNRSILTNIHHASTSALQGAHALLAHEKRRAIAPNRHRPAQASYATDRRAISWPWEAMWTSGAARFLRTPAASY